MILVFLWIMDPDPVFSRIRIRGTQKDRIRNTAFRSYENLKKRVSEDNCRRFSLVLLIGTYLCKIVVFARYYRRFCTARSRCNPFYKSKKIV